MRTGFRIAAILACGLASAKGDEPARPAPGGIRWAGSFAEAVERARADHKLVMVDFYTDS